MQRRGTRRTGCRKRKKERTGRDGGVESREDRGARWEDGGQNLWPLYHFTSPCRVSARRAGSHDELWHSTPLHSTNGEPPNFLVYSRSARERLHVHLFPLSPLSGLSTRHSGTGIRLRRVGVGRASSSREMGLNNSIASGSRGGHRRAPQSLAEHRRASQSCLSELLPYHSVKCECQEFYKKFATRRAF